jgi:glycosyltransferase involved in cell wall biosynthesis
MHLAYFSPLPPARTGIADYSAELLPHLARLSQLTLFHPEPEQVAAAIRQQFPVKPYPYFQANRTLFDLLVYQMGNSTYHTDLYRMAMRYPGVVVLHDLVLHHFIEAITRQQGDEAGYLQAVGYALGGEQGSLRRYLHLRHQPDRYNVASLNQVLVDRSLLILVHSQYGQQQLAAQGCQQPVAVIAQPMVRQEVVSQRPTLNWPETAVVFAALGQITRAKQVLLGLKAFARLRTEYPESRFLLVGEPMAEEVDIESEIAALQLEDVVYMTGFVPDLAEFAGWIAAADVILNLRHPTMGETSATALRGMAQGKPLIVFDHGWYKELPDAAAFKLPPLNEEALYQTMRTLAQSAELRHTMGDAAAHYIQQYHQPAQVAERIIAHLQEWLMGA